MIIFEVKRFFNLVSNSEKWSMVLFKGTVNVISSDPPLIGWQVCFKTKKLLLIKYELEVDVFVLKNRAENFRIWYP